MKLAVHSDYIIEPWFEQYQVNIGIRSVSLEEKEGGYSATLEIFKPAVVFTVTPPQTRDVFGRQSSTMTPSNRSLSAEFQALAKGEWTVVSGGKTWLNLKLTTPYGAFWAQLRIISEGGVPDEVIKTLGQ